MTVFLRNQNYFKPMQTIMPILFHVALNDSLSCILKDKNYFKNEIRL